MAFLFLISFSICSLVSFACNYYFVTVTTSCGRTAVASGCTTSEIIADAMAWDNLLCGSTPMP